MEQAIKKSASGFSLVGKYRDIAIAAGLFVVFDLFVLILNFYTSFEIAADASAINLAGRQRMLSQRMTKSLLQIDKAQTTEDFEGARSELKLTYQLFDKTFYAFKTGGVTKNTDGTEIILVAVEDEVSQNTLQEAELIWKPLAEQIQILLTKSYADHQAMSTLSTALVFANNNNLQLLKLMNQLTTRLAELAKNKAERLRMFQTIGITLALINFALLLFHFIRKLGRSDAAADEARKETDEILTTVGEGFFLLDKDLNLGHQHSAAMETIFKKSITPGSPFLALFEGKVSQQTLEMTKEYIQLLFKKRIRENLASSLNPLVRLEIDLSNDSTQPDIHYLNINFRRVQAENEITHVLGSISDITEQVALEKSLEVAESRAKEEVELLSQILQNDPEHIRQYLQATKQLLLNINSQIEKSKSAADFSEIINQSLPAIHQVKGDASAIGSELFASLAHEFEEILKALQFNASLETEDLLPVVVHINHTLSKIGMVNGIIDKISKLSSKKSAAKELARSEQFEVDLKNLADTAASDLGKKINLVFSEVNFNYISDNAARSIRNICIQMARNAIAHGIELPKTRKLDNKPAYGTVNISVIAEQDSTTLQIKDDGRGMDLNKIKRAILESGRLTKRQLAEMDDKSILMHIFYSGISTANEVNKHSGQGLGLTIVKQAIRDLDGSMTINYKTGKYTEFKFVFSNVELAEPAEVLTA